MDLLKIQADYATISISKDEVFILRAILSEIYAGVCIDSEEIEVIHGFDKDDVLKVDSGFKILYEKMDSL